MDRRMGPLYLGSQNCDEKFLRTQWPVSMRSDTIW